MEDLYLKCNSLDELKELLQANEIDFPYEGDHLETVECQGVYVPAENFFLEWIGKVPKTKDEDGNVLEYYSGLRFNVRPYVESDFFNQFDGVTPETPYRQFA